MPQNADFLQKNDDISKTKMFSVLKLIWGRRYYKLGQTLLQIRAAITNRAIITNWGITNTFYRTFVPIYGTLSLSCS